MIIDKLPDIHFMVKYRAHEGNYGLFSPNILYSCNKLNDIYFAYCNARSCLIYLDNKDFGDFAKDENSKLFVKAQLVMNAINYYNSLIDFSWQFMWFYIRTDLNNKLLTNKIYTDESKKCDYNTLRYYLTLKKKNKIKEYYIEKFFNDDITQELREMWNYLKHRGTYYFDGLDFYNNDSEMCCTFNGLVIPLVNRRSLGFDETLKLLIRFDEKYFEYMNNLINIVFPDNFLTTNDLLSSPINYCMNNLEELKRINKKESQN